MFEYFHFLVCCLFVFAMQRVLKIGKQVNNKYTFYPSDEFYSLGMHIYYSIRNMEMKNFHQIKVNSRDEQTHSQSC